MSASGLSDAESARTIRQQILPEFGAVAQQKLNRAHVAVVGVGGLGAPVISYLAAAGVGTLTVIDDDDIEVSNLHRQVIHDHARIGMPKTLSAVEVASKLAPEARVIEVRDRLTAENATDVLRDCDLIVDGSDSFDTRFVVNSAAAELGVPIVWGAVLRWDAQVTVLFPNPPADSGTLAISLTDIFADTEQTRQTVSCATAGVMGAICGQAGSMMALEAIKLITQVGEPLLGRLVVIDGLNATTQTIPLGMQSAQVEASDIPARTRSTLVRALSSIPSQVLVVDVRTAEEVAKAPGPSGSILLPLDQLLQLPPILDGVPDALAHASDALPLLIVCAEGPRSLRAARHLVHLGYPVAGFLDGGLTAMKASA